MRRSMIAVVSMVAVMFIAGLAGPVWAGTTYYRNFDFETSWSGDYAPGWENTLYRHGDPPIGKMMQYVQGGHNSAGAVKLIADSVPQAWMWWAAVSVKDVCGIAMQKQYDPWFSAWYYDDQVADRTGQIFAVPSWVNGYTGDNKDEDWTDIQHGARFNQPIDGHYYYVAAGQNSPGWQDTGKARSTGWHQLKMQLSSADGKVHFYIDGVEVGSSYRSDYIDLGEELGLYTMFLDPLSAWGGDKPYTIWDNVELGSSAIPGVCVPEPLTVASAFFAVGGLGAYIRRRRRSSARA